MTSIRKYTIQVSLIILLESIFALSVFADTTIFFGTGYDNELVTDYDGQAESIISSQYPDAPVFDSNVIQIGKTSTYEYRSLIKFDVSSMACEFAFINSAKLRLFYCNSGNTGNNFICGIYEISSANADWYKKTATWNHLKATVPTEDWAGSVGLGSVGVDYEPVELAQWVHDFDKPDGSYVDVPLSPFLVKEWILGINSGLLIKYIGTPPDSVANYYGSDASDANYCPLLIIGYLPGQTCNTLWQQDLGYAPDFNKDCKVDFKDFAVLVENWLLCYDPNVNNCP